MIEPKTTNKKQLLSSHLNLIEKMETETLYVKPCETKKTQKIFLTKSNSAWITIAWISNELKKYSQTHYQEMFDLHPIERGKVVMFGEEVNSPRWHRSYLKIPSHNIRKERSFMYSGKEFYKDLSLPSKFQGYLDFLNKKEDQEKYNQVIVNWYADGNDFIAAHSDCQIGMKAGAGISIITLCEDVNSFRALRFTAKNLKGIENDNIYKHVKIVTTHGSIITMYGDTQKKFKHKIPKALGLNSSRISLTFRKF